MAYGTPTTRDDIEEYYTRIRHGRAPTPEQLADLTRRYDAIGGTSPLARRTADQVAGIQRVLNELAPGKYDVRYGSKYEPPLLESTAATFRDDGVTDVVGLVLAPHSSSMSTDQYMARAREALGDDVSFTEIGAWWEFPGFLELIAERVNGALATIPDERRVTTDVISKMATPIPISYARARNVPPQLPTSIAGILRGSRPAGHPTRGSDPTFSKFFEPSGPKE
jgi:ferrochelatase